VVRGVAEKVDNLAAALREQLQCGEPLPEGVASSSERLREALEHFQ